MQVKLKDRKIKERKKERKKKRTLTGLEPLYPANSASDALIRSTNYHKKCTTASYTKKTKPWAQIAPGDSCTGCDPEATVQNEVGLLRRISLKTKYPQGKAVPASDRRTLPSYTIDLKI